MGNEVTGNLEIISSFSISTKMVSACSWLWKENEKKGSVNGGKVSDSE